MSEALQTGRKCSICTHDSTIEIDKSILKGDSFRDISLRYGMSHASVARHASDCLETDLAVVLREAKQANRIQSIVDVYNEFYEQLEHVKRLRKAAVDWMTDPVTGEINLDPRASEVDIIYQIVNQEGDSENFTRKKEKLHIILNRLQGNIGVNVTAELKTTDLRDWTLKVIDRCDVVIDKFAKLEGKYAQDKPNPEAIDTTLLKLINTLIDWITETFPKPPEEHQAFQNEVVERFGAWDSASLKQLFTDAAELADNYKDAINK